MVKIAVIGFGNIGGGLVELIDKHKEIIARDCGTEVEVKYIVDIRDFTGHPLESKIVKDFNVVLNDPEVSIVAEMIGGSHPAFDFSIAALKAGKHVVSSNKEVVANFGEQLLAAAAENKVAYLFEASVGGAIPIIRPMRESLSSDDIISVNGILNGTTNFILTNMLYNGKAFEDALAEAQALGYAEANPSADVDGIDACRKICILAALAYGVIYPCDSVATEGIRNISKRDASDASELGASIKLIGHAEKTADGKVLISVCPRMVPSDVPLSSVNDVFNGIMVSGKAVGDLMFYGRGAGRIPTAGAVLADIVEIVKHLSCGQLPPSKWTRGAGSELADAKAAVSKFYCRVNGNKIPEGAIEVIQKDGETAIVTAPITEYELDEMTKGFEVVSKIRFFA
ncbi:MAG: homoserine dehydrogenase [Ruminococcaceae bacterium]|nr:homoserine dehydrogenase [Oscillospiraceae bacterium]